MPRITDVSISDFLKFSTVVTCNKEDIKMKHFSLEKRVKLSCDEITHFFEVLLRTKDNEQWTHQPKEKIVLKFFGCLFPNTTSMVNKEIFYVNQTGNQDELIKIIFKGFSE